MVKAITTAALLLTVCVAPAHGLSANRADGASSLVKQSLEVFEHAEETLSREQRIALYRRGLTLAEKAVELDPNNADAHYAEFVNRGRMVALEGTAAAIGQLGKLRASLQRALELDPNHVGALIGRASLYRESPAWLGGSLKKAEADFRRALALDPRAIDAQLGLASTYLKEGRTGDAARLLNDARPSASESGRLRYEREVESLSQQLAAEHCGESCRF